MSLRERANDRVREWNTKDWDIVVTASEREQIVDLVLEEVRLELINRGKQIEQQMLDSPKHSFTFGDVLRFIVKAIPEMKETPSITSCSENGEKQ